MNILIVGTHPHVRQPSMSLFAGWLMDAARPLGKVSLITAPAAFLTAKRRGSKAAKWLAYLDQYALLPLILGWRAMRSDLVVVADQGNAPSAVLVPRRKLVVMVHDTIAMRQALGQIPEAPPTGRSGVILQAMIRRSVKRARLLLSNPGAIPGEIERLGLGERIAVVGCPADYSRLERQADTLPVHGRYILNVASDGWRKRKRALIPLWKAVQARSDLKLVLAGHTDDATHEAFLKEGVFPIVLNDVSNETLASLYANACGLISPSLEEGLCIPVLEALHFDKPIFLPDVSPSYADFFGKATHRLPFETPDAAADTLRQGTETPPDQEATAAVQAWAALEAFQARVQAALTI